MFTAIFVSVFVVAWLLLAFVPWLALSVATHGDAGLANLPLCLVAGLVGGLAVPLLGKEDETGIVLSMVAAVIAPSLLLMARRFSAGGREASQTSTVGPE